MYPVIFRLLTCYSCLFLSLNIWAQKATPPLERVVTIRVSNETISSVLTQLSQQSQIKFSYNPTIVPATKKVSMYLTQRPVRVVLNALFGETMHFKQRGNFIIITPKPPKTSESQAKEVTITGYVYYDNGDKVVAASVLNKNDQVAAVTNEYGYFKIKASAKKMPVNLKVEKENHEDTVLLVKEGETTLDVVLQPQAKESVPEVKKEETQATEKDSIITQPAAINEQEVIKADTAKPLQQAVLPADTTTAVASADTSKSFIDKLFLSDESKANIRNLKDTLFANIQFSLIPQISTNKLLVGNTENAVSFNLLVGYSQGVKVTEFAGLVNVDRGNVQFAQFAGLANDVRGTVIGAQFAGLVNKVKGTVDGGQFAGLFNSNKSTFRGTQFAGLMNIDKDTVEGAQFAGLANIDSKHIDGTQFAGLFNSSPKTEGASFAGLFNQTATMDGVQMAGLMNIVTHTTSGAQFAGLFNYSPDVKGSQVAGLFNRSKYATGWQISGLFNSAKYIKGVQLGVFNFSDSCDGIPLGFFSYSKRGYRKLEVFTDEIVYTSLAFRTGVSKLHNIFIAGANPSTVGDNILWTFGYGLGSCLPMSEKWNLCMDLTTQVVVRNDRVTNAPQVNTFFVGMERKLGNKAAVVIGPACRLLITYKDEPVDTEVMNKITPYTIHSETFTSGGSLQLWVGGKVAFRFL